MSTATSAHVSTGGSIARPYPDESPEPDAEGNEQKIEILTGKHRAGLYH